MLRELGPYCEPDSLVVNRLLEVVQHNQIMHLSSTIRGQLRTDQDCLDAALALFPSTMVSGVPKSQAIAPMAGEQNLKALHRWYSDRSLRQEGVDLALKEISFSFLDYSGFR